MHLHNYESDDEHYEPADEENGAVDEHECPGDYCTNIAHYDTYEEYRAATQEEIPGIAQRIMLFTAELLITTSIHNAACGHWHLISSIQTAWHTSKEGKIQ